MNRRKNNTARTALYVCSTVLVLSLLSGCSEKPNEPDTEPSFVDLVTIICTPLAPAPGSEAVLTVQAEGQGPSAKYYWTVEAGSLQAEEGIGVIWTVPDTTGVFEVSVRGTLGETVDQQRKKVMVINCEILNTGLKTSLRPQLVGTYNILYLMGSKNYYPTDERFPGFHAYTFSASTDCKSLCGSLDGAENFVFFDEGFLGTMYTLNTVGVYRQRPINVWFFPTAIGSEVNISNDTAGAKWGRKNQHINPHATHDFNLVVWQENKVGKERDGTADLINIVTKRRSDPFSPYGSKTYLSTNIDSVFGDTTYTYNYWNNVKPTITPAEDWIIFFRDTTGTFEPCVVPIVGGIPDPGQFQALKGPSGKGIFKDAKISMTDQTVFQWNKAFNVLGFIAKDGQLCYFFTSGSPDEWYVEKLTDVGPISEFVWSADGSVCAVVTERGISIVDLAGNSTEVFIKEKFSDEVIGLNWSRITEHPKLAFRVVRKGKGTIESWSAVVVCSPDNGDWYYASPDRTWDQSVEPIVNYTWMRVIFELDDKGLYAPMPVTDIPGKRVVIYHCYE